MMDGVVLITVVFGAVSLMAYGLLSLFFAEDRLVGRRLASLTKYESAEVKEAQPLLKSFGERFFVPLAEKVSGALGNAGPDGYMQGLQRRIVLAGEPGGVRASGLLAAKVGLAAMLGFLCAVPGMVELTTLALTLLLVVGGLVVGFALPSVWLKIRTEKRQQAIRRDLPDMLEMLTISVEAGLGFDAALAKYVKNSRSVLAYEFGRVLKEIQGGMSRRDALRHLGVRVEVSELNSFIAAMIQADMLGISVAQVLRTQASEIRLRRKQYIEEQAQKLPVKMVFPVILCILPATIVVVMGPAILMLMELFGG